MLTDETRYRILKLLEAEPHASQRRIADELGLSLGRVNFCVQALVEKGLVKVNNFRNNANKRTILKTYGVIQFHTGTYQSHFPVPPHLQTENDDPGSQRYRIHPRQKTSSREYSLLITKTPQHSFEPPFSGEVFQRSRILSLFL